MPGRHVTLSFAVALGLASSGTLFAASGPLRSSDVERQIAVRAADGTVVAAYERSGRIRRLSGAAMARGATPLAAAERFLRDNAALVGPRGRPERLRRDVPARGVPDSGVLLRLRGDDGRPDGVRA